MSTASTETVVPATVDLEPASPEVKRYSQLKQVAVFASIGISLVFVIVAALFVGPRLDPLVKGWLGEHGDNRWLQLVIVAFIYGAGLEMLTMPIDFWSGFFLEHQYQLSNQTFRAWIWKRVKG